MTSRKIWKSTYYVAYLVPNIWDISNIMNNRILQRTSDKLRERRIIRVDWRMCQTLARALRNRKQKLNKLATICRYTRKKAGVNICIYQQRHFIINCLSSLYIVNIHPWLYQFTLCLCIYVHILVNYFTLSDK